MSDNGRSSKVISEDLGISIATVCRYVGDYQSGGIENLLESHCKGYWGKLDSMQLCALRNELREHIYTDVKSVSEWIVLYLFYTNLLSLIPPLSQAHLIILRLFIRLFANYRST